MEKLEEHVHELGFHMEPPWGHSIFNSEKERPGALGYMTIAIPTCPSLQDMDEKGATDLWASSTCIGIKTWKLSPESFPEKFLGGKKWKGMEPLVEGKYLGLLS